MQNHSVQDRDYRLWVLFHQTRSASFKVRERDISKYGITATQASVLFVISAIGKKATPTLLAKWLIREPHTMSSILTRMEKVGLVKKVRNPDDKTQVIVAMTKKGRELNDQALNHIEVIHDMLSSLSEEEYQVVYSCLSKIRDKALSYLVKITNVPYP